ncbi:glycosyltransferase [Neomoorella humiferrea]|uniref:glycosyltransferase n=1 Tax=Neomoorella humiferrea TaxID=676965 RepID=UPI003D8FDE92
MFIITGLNYGGAEMQLVRLAIQLKARGWKVMVVSMLLPVAYVEELKAAGIPVTSLGMRRGVPDPRALFRLARILRRERPQVVHSHMVHANILARLVRPLVKVPVLVCTAHSFDEGGHYRELAYRFTDFLCDLTTQVSHAGLERYVRVGAVPRPKIRFVPNGVDIERFRPNPEARVRLRHELNFDNAFVWLAVGRFEEAKDYPNMLRAFAKVLRSGKNAILLIAGQGTLKDEAESLALELGIARSVRFLGVRQDVPDLMNAADAYVMSSAWEGMPMVLLEAGAVGLPVVATDVGGNREVVLDTRSGFLVPPKDSDALACSMLQLMDMYPEERRRMGQVARAHIEANYSLERVVDQWEALYRELLAEKGYKVM